MEKEQNRKVMKGLIGYTSEWERKFFFFATIVMFIFYCLTSLLSD